MRCSIGEAFSRPGGPAHKDTPARGSFEGHLVCPGHTLPGIWGWPVHEIFTRRGPRQGFSWAPGVCPGRGLGGFVADLPVPVWSVIWSLDASETSAPLLRGDAGRTASDVLDLGAKIASFGGVAPLWIRQPLRDPRARGSDSSGFFGMGDPTPAPEEQAGHQHDHDNAGDDVRGVIDPRLFRFL